ncbi:MAG: 50S ribosomal protein L23 [Candidatus Eisenbacteria bacterium]|nr:50S ribosomal protein L23 [Candidatus Eisenbacteria bacterium]
MKRDPRTIILEPIVTEKTSAKREFQNEVAFKVARDANKIEIRDAVEELFDVAVADVRTMSVTGKIKRLGRFEGRRASWKKAIVKLKEGQTIEFFEHA